jgi:hypothetical protein
VERNQNSPKPTSNIKSLLTWSWSLQPIQCGTHALQDNAISSIDPNIQICGYKVQNYIASTNKI